jgi:L-fuculose-phosphate aldolase
MIKTEDELRKEIVEIGRSIHRLGFVAAYDGNISARLDNHRILSTPTTISKGMMRPDDLIIVDYEGKKISGRRNPTSEIAMHLLIYRRRPDVQAVVHAHPPTATGYAAAGLSLNKALVSEVVLSLGCIPLARYGTPGTPELTEALEPLVGSYDAILMANHGVVTCGPNLAMAYYRMETVEHFAKISLVTELLGRQVLLSGSEVDKLLAARQKYFGSSARSIERSDSCPVSNGAREQEERMTVTAEAVARMKK